MSTDLHRYASEEAKARGLTKAEVLGRSRHRTAVAARHAVIRRLYNDGIAPYAIARLIGRDNSTVRSALSKTGVTAPRVRTEANGDLGAILGSRALLERQVRYHQYPCKIAGEE